MTLAATEGDVSGAFTLTVARQSGGAADANYFPLAQTLFATVSTLPDVATASDSAAAPYAANAGIHDFRAALGGVYADATFVRDDAGSSEELGVSAEGVVFNAAAIAATGTYTLVASATSDDYLGTARAAYELTLTIFRTTVTVGDRARGFDSAVVMEYAGVRNGLDVMRSLGSVQAGQAELQAISRFAIFGERLCSEIGSGWRNPKLTEVAMLLSSPPASRLTAGVVPAAAAGAICSPGFTLIFARL